jgi:hypothetical protein
MPAVSAPLFAGFDLERYLQIFVRQPAYFGFGNIMTPEQLNFELGADLEGLRFRHPEFPCSSEVLYQPEDPRIPPTMAFRAGHGRIKVLLIGIPHENEALSATDDYEIFRSFCSNPEMLEENDLEVHCIPSLSTVGFKMQAWLRTEASPDVRFRSEVKAEPLDLATTLLGQQRTWADDLVWESRDGPMRTAASAAVRAYIERHDFDVIEEGHNEHISEGLSLFVERDDPDLFDIIESARDALGIKPAPTEQSTKAEIFRFGVYRMPPFEGRRGLIETGAECAKEAGKTNFQGVNVDNAMFVPTRWPKKIPRSYATGRATIRVWEERADDLRSLAEFANAHPPEGTLEKEFVRRSIAGMMQLGDAKALRSSIRITKTRDRVDEKRVKETLAELREFGFSGARVGPTIRMARHYGFDELADTIENAYTSDIRRGQLLFGVQQVPMVVMRAMHSLAVLATIASACGKRLPFDPESPTLNGMRFDASDPESFVHTYAGGYSLPHARDATYRNRPDPSDLLESLRDNEPIPVEVNNAHMAIEF